MSYPEITALEAHDELDGYRVIDVREAYEFHGPLGCLECAELIPLATVEANAEKLDGNRSLLLVCRSGKRSGKACQTLEELGVHDVTNLSGGMIAWNRAELPVRHAEPKNLTELVERLTSWAAQVGPMTPDAALELVRLRFRRQNVSLEAPTRGAVEELITFVGETLATVDPPDLDLSLASFRRWLAVL